MAKLGEVEMRDNCLKHAGEWLCFLSKEPAGGL